MEEIYTSISREDNYTLYIHINNINGKMYVGITCNPVRKRWGHKGCGYCTQSYFWSAIKKYGWDNFEHIIFAEHLTREEACNMEKYMIKYFNTTDRQHGYNIHSGGSCFDYIQRKEQSKTMSGNKHRYYGKHRSESVRKKISESLSGENHPCYGKHLSETTRKRISESEKGRKKAPNAGTQPKPVICVETGVIYPSTAEASRQVGVHHTAITMVLTGRRKRAGNFHWQYYNNMSSNAS